jgi:hypothetical protein
MSIRFEAEAVSVVGDFEFFKPAHDRRFRRQPPRWPALR